MKERKIKSSEVLLTKWLIDNEKNEKNKDLLGGLTVNDDMMVTECCCGCPSFDFVQEDSVKQGGMLPVSSWYYGEGENSNGIFLYLLDGKLGGVEIYSFGSMKDMGGIPNVEDLRPAVF